LLVLGIAGRLACERGRALQRATKSARQDDAAGKAAAAMPSRLPATGALAAPVARRDVTNEKLHTGEAAMKTLTRRALWMLAVLASTIGLLIEPAAAQKVGTEGKPLVVGTVRFFGFLPAYRVVDELKAQGIAAKIVEFPSAT
jgi:hypothetical protein